MEQAHDEEADRGEREWEHRRAAGEVDLLHVPANIQPDDGYARSDTGWIRSMPSIHWARSNVDKFYFEIDGASLKGVRKGINADADAAINTTGAT